VADIQPGSAVSCGEGKCAASTEARALFCMPVSIDIVLALGSDAPMSFEMVYPNRNPAECRAIIAPRSFILGTANCIPLLAAEMEPHMSDTNSTDIKGVNSDTADDSLGSLVLISNPSATGASTTCKVDIIKSLGLTFTKDPASLVVSL
jgi:hypothetical protein